MSAHVSGCVCEKEGERERERFENRYCERTMGKRNEKVTGQIKK